MLSVQRWRETEEGVNDDIRERRAADALLHAAHALGKAHRRVELFALWSKKFPRLSERPFLRNHGCATVKIKRIIRKAQSPHRADRKRWPAIIRAHGSVVWSVRN